MRIDDQMLFLGGSGAPSGPSLPNLVANGLTCWIHGADFPVSSADTIESRAPDKTAIAISGWEFSETNGNRGDGCIFNNNASSPCKIFITGTQKKAMLNQNMFTMQFQIDSTGVSWSTGRTFLYSHSTFFSILTTSTKKLKMRLGRRGAFESPVVTDKCNIAVTWATSTEYLRFYMNGSFVASYRLVASGFPAIPIFDVLSGTQPLAIFNDDSTTSLSPFIGGLKEMVFYNRTLTDAEILQNYNEMK